MRHPWPHLFWAWIFPLATCLSSSLWAAPTPGSTWPDTTQQGEDLKLLKVITGNIRPKSIVHTGRGRFFAQNMVYRHSITVYNRNQTLIKTIDDRVRLSDFMELGYTGSHQGGPVEACFSPDGKYAYVSNYQMTGQGFELPGGDNCDPADNYDHSYVYRVDVNRLVIDQVIAVGSVPKFLAASPDGRLVLVANWCGGSLSVIDTKLGQETARIALGRYPRGSAIDSKSRFANLALMGEDRVAVINLASSDYSISWIEDLGQTPRHLCLGPADRFLYLSLSRPGKVLKYDLVKETLVAEVETGREARSMVLTPQGRFLYVVNYRDHTLTKLATDHLRVIQTVDTRPKPIGVTFDAQTRQVWVACYSGSIMVFQDQRYLPLTPTVKLDQVGPLPPENPRHPPLSYVPGTPASPPDPLHYIRREVVPVSSSTSQRTRAVSAADPPQSASDQRFIIVVGSYQARSRAQKRVADLKRQGYQAFIRSHKAGRFRVCTHTFTFTLRAEALRTLREVKQSLNPEAWLLVD